MARINLDETILLELLQQQPQSIIYYAPVWDFQENIITDFEISFCNAEAERLSGLGADQLIGRRVMSIPEIEEEQRTQLFRDLQKVFTDGKPLETEMFSHQLQRHFSILRTKLKTGVLTLARDITNEVQSNKLTKSILQSSINGIFACKAIREKTEVKDFQFININPSFSKIMHSKDRAVIGNTLLSLFPGAAYNGAFDLFKEVLETGMPNRKEVRYRDEDVQTWYDLSVSRMDRNIVVVNFSDITNYKQLEMNDRKRIKALTRMNRLASSILDSSLDAIYVAEAVRENDSIQDFRIIKANNRCQEMMGISESEMKATTLSQFFPGIREQGFIDLLIKVIETGTPERLERLYHGDGQDGWFEFSVVRMDKNRVLVTYRNISEHKKAIQEIGRQKTLMDNILKHSPSGITVTEVIRDEEGRVVDGRTILSNEIAERYTGIPTNVGLTKTLKEIDPALLDSTIYHKALETLSTGLPFRDEYFLEPTSRWLEISVARMDRDHLINLFTDVTSTKVAQLQLEKSVDELKRSNASLEEFAYAASHDMQEPIRKIHYFANRIREQYGHQLDKQAVYYFERLEQAANRMRLLVEDLLAYSHVSMKPGVPEIVDLNEIVHTVIEDLDLVISEKKALVHIGRMPRIRGHKRQLQQLFQNLIGNALKYSREGRIPEIEVSAELLTGAKTGLDLNAEDQKKNFHVISVIDNGIGFEQKEADRIFQVFQRLHGNAEYRGTGIGLAIARKVVQNHRGYITAAGVPDKGSIFKVFLQA